MPVFRSTGNGGKFTFTLNSYVGMTLNSSAEIGGAQLSDNNTVLICSESSPSTIKTLLTLIVKGGPFLMGLYDFCVCWVSFIHKLLNGLLNGAIWRVS